MASSSAPAPSSMATPPPPPPPTVQVTTPYGGRGPRMMALTWTFLIIVTFLLVPRLYLRWKTWRKSRDSPIDWALWWAVATYLTFAASGCCFTVAAHFGLGNNLYDLTLANVSNSIEFLWLTVFFHIISTGVSKVSVVCYLIALGRRTHKYTKWLLYAIAISNLLFNFSIVWYLFFTCDPVEAAWDKTIVEKTCDTNTDRRAVLSIVQAAWNGIADVVCALYPCYLVYKLTLALRLKLFVCSILGLGVIGGILSFVKLYWIYINTDPWVDLVTLLMLGLAENFSVLFALSVPPIWPLVKPYVEKMKSATSSSSHLRHKLWPSSSTEPKRTPGSTQPTLPVSNKDDFSNYNKYWTNQSYSFATRPSLDSDKSDKTPHDGGNNATSASRGGINVTRAVSVGSSYPMPQSHPPMEHV